MTKARFVLCVLLIAVFAAFAAFNGVLAQGAPPSASGLLIYNAWVRPTAAALTDGATAQPPIPGTVSGAYMTIENTGSTDVQLVGVSDNLAQMSMLHQTTMDSKGVMSMQPIPSLAIPAGKTVALDTSDYHVMLENVFNDIYPGEAVALTLTFKDSGGATFSIPVGAIAGDNPPAADPLIVANAIAQPDASNPQALDVSLIFDNIGTQGDTLTGASSTTASSAALMHFSQSGIAPFASIYVPPQAQTILTPQTAFIQVSGLAAIATPDATAATMSMSMPAATQASMSMPASTEAPAALSSVAFPLTLTFQSGKTITIAVPVTGAAS